MNKLNLFLAIAATLLIGYSCTTDATDDLGVEFDGGTTLALSLEGSRTQLSEKADGVYPLYWSDGDKITVNGAESAEAVIGENRASASFSFSAILSTPYCITYPVAPAGKVLFVENQTHVGNTTFASGVSTMYAYSPDGSNIEMKYLSGVLKIGVVGSTTLTHAQISTVDRTPIAGAFDFDFVNGVATPSSDAKSVINYSFGEGVTLSSEPTYIHAVVPAGVYNELYVTLFDNAGGVMYATVKADDTKPLVAGNVREFSNQLNYLANESVYVIKDVASLKAFAAAAPTLTTDAVIVADIDMTGEEWSTIAAPNYANTLRGNGYAIKGLTAPLFGQTKASFKGVHLVDVDIKTEGERMVGALVNYMTNAAATVNNCSVSGNIVVNNDVAPTSYISIGGIIGTAHAPTTDFTNLHNKANLTVTGNYGNITRIGGIVGYAKCSLTNCSNIGTITFSGISSKGSVSVAGICGAYDAGSDHAANGCVNGSLDDATGSLGAIIVNGTSTATFLVAGCLGNITSSPETLNCANYAKINFSGVSKASLLVGGVVGQTLGNISNCVNGRIDDLDGTIGEIYIGGEFGLNINFGGVVGSSHIAGRIVDNCHNYANVTYESTATSTTTDEEGEVLGGGVCGKVNVITNSSNQGNILANGSGRKYYIGGVAGYDTSSTNVSSAVTNLGSVTYGGTYTYLLMLGGVIGRGDGCIDCTNGSKDDSSLGLITVNGTCTAIMGPRVGGCVAASEGTYENCTNYGHIYVGHKAQVGLYAGGIFATTAADMTATKSYNYGKISIAGEFAAALHVGGLTSINEYKMTFTDCHNYGDIEFEEGLNIVLGDTRVGGIMGYLMETNGSSFTDCSSSGDITFNGTTTGGLIMGGCIGFATVTDTSVESSLRNYTNNISNSGTLTIAGTVNGKSIRLGGVIGVANKLSYNASKMGGYQKNSGKLIYKCDFKHSSGDLAIGGYIGTKVGDLYANTFSPINTGDIECLVTPLETQTTNVGGIIGKNSGIIGNSKCFCSILASGYPNVGMAIGNARSSDNIASSCCVGGRFGVTDIEDETTSFLDITLDNYTNYIYGGTTDWTDVEDYDNCKYISSIDATPLSKE